MKNGEEERTLVARDGEFKLRFKSIDFLSNTNKNYNKQKQMYCFILLFNSSMTDFTVTGSGTLILCNVQLTMLERFSAIMAIY